MTGNAVNAAEWYAIGGAAFAFANVGLRLTGLASPGAALKASIQAGAPLKLKPQS